MSVNSVSTKKKPKKKPAEKKSKISTLHDLMVSSAVCASFFGVSLSAIRQWKSNSCPHAGHGMWNLVEVFNWWQENIMSSKVEDSDTDIKTVKLDYWKAKTRVEEVKAATLEEKYLPREELSEEWSYRAGVYRSGLLAFSARLPPLLEGKKQLEMRAILHDESCKLLTALSRDSKETPIAALPKEYTKIKETKSCKKPKKKTSGRKKKRP